MTAPAQSVTGAPGRWLRSVGLLGVTVVAGVAVLAVVAVTTPAFLTVDNVRAVVGTAAVTGTVAVGLTFVTLSGNLVSLSLSLEQTAGLCAVALALLLGAAVPVGVALLAVVAVAGVAGAVQGGVVALGANPVVVTLGAGAALYGAATILSGGRAVVAGDGALTAFGAAAPLGLPIATIAFVVVTVLATVFHHRHRAGRSIALVGENRAAAVAFGLPVAAMTVCSFVLSALTCVVVAVLAVAAFGLGNPDQFGGLTFDAIATVLIGGTAVRGGRGSPAHTALGAVFIAVLLNVMLLRGWPYGVRLTVEGAVVVLAVSAYHVLGERRRQ